MLMKFTQVEKPYQITEVAKWVLPTVYSTLLEIYTDTLKPLYNHNNVCHNKAYSSVA